MPSEAERRTQAWLSEHRNLYERCKKKLEDPDKVLEAWEALAKMFTPILAYRQDSPPHEAVFVIASLKANVDEFFKEVLFVKEYREKIKRLHELEDREEDGLGPTVDPMAGLTVDWPS